MESRSWDRFFPPNGDPTNRESRSWDTFFPSNGDPSNRRFQSQTRPPMPKTSKPIPPESKRSPYSPYVPTDYSTTEADAERIAWIKARSDETRRKFEELRIRNYVDHYFNMAMLNAKLSRLLAEDDLGPEMQERERNKKPDNSPKPPKKYVFYSGAEDGLRYKTLKDGPKNVEFRVAVDVKSCIPRNIHIDSKEHVMTVKATTLGGRVKTLGIICPSAEDVDGIQINIPKNGILLIEGPKIDCKNN